MKSHIDAVLVGAGRRGTNTFGEYATRFSDHVRYIAVAEPRDEYRDNFAHLHDIPEELRFNSWEDLIARGQLAPALLNTTNDQTHFPVSMAAAEAGYQVMSEKPMATTPEECVKLGLVSEKAPGAVWVFHDLRNTEFFSKAHEVVQSGRLGEVLSVQHAENVSYWHMSHSWVRGNWRKKASSAPMMLTKCCHDMDVISWNMGLKVERLTSFGSLRHLTADQAPHPDVPERCTDGCPIEEECDYYAPRLYVKQVVGQLATALGVNLDEEGQWEALRTGPYGRCVYRSDNDVVDHQVVAMEFEGGATATHTVHGFSHKEMRTIRYDGARGTMIGTFHRDGPEITVFDHRSGDEETFTSTGGAGGHGGGDDRLISAFVQAIRTDDFSGLSPASEAAESHLMALAAEESRLNGGAPVEMASYRQRAHDLAAAMP